MFKDRIYGTRFLETRCSRNEHMDTKGCRVVICRCMKSLYIKGREYIFMPRFKVKTGRSKYNIRKY